MRSVLLFCLMGLSVLAHSQQTPDPQDSLIDTTGTTIQIQTSSVVVQADSVSEGEEKAELEEKISLKEPPFRISLAKIVWSLVVFMIGYFIIRFCTRVLGILAERSTTERRITVKGFVPVVRIVGWVVIIYVVIAGIIRPPIETVLAFTASVAVAVGFASQDILKNIFGGIVILLDQPFKMGDKIEIGSFYGEVVEIGLRSTRIVTPDDSLVSIPNGELMNQSVSNSNAGEPNCQVVAEIYLPINIDTARVRSIATEAAQTSRYIFLNKPITVLFFNELKDRRPYLKMRLKAYVMDIRYEFIFKSELTEIVLRELLYEELITVEDYD
uniref:Mechanosensitive ion channel n=1 Tax=Roseihalotalea indica TaxID=2867963 RepID=A0AA49JIT8_9BACT|nr:mechanosensitive ion channel [Tunicatimonas sp. TK19036]